MSCANFHIHTFFSDGTTSPADVVRKIGRTKDLKYFAITDHDTLSGIEPVFRILKQNTYGASCNDPTFIPGIELSLREPHSGCTVHLIGLYPHITCDNHKEELVRIDAVLGDFCRNKCLRRVESDMDGRVLRAFDLNLDAVRELFGSPEELIGQLKALGNQRNDKLFREMHKVDDVIQHPIPISYQVIIENWEDLVPHSSKEKITLYVLRPDRGRKAALAEIYRSEGILETRALELAELHQGALAVFPRPRPIMETDSAEEGLVLLKKTDALTFLAHPAVAHDRMSIDEFDRLITFPLIDQGLDGIEVYYPYDQSYRRKAIHHYRNIACERNLLVSGGTDFHGDDRIGLDEITLPCEEAERIMDFRSSASLPL